MKFPQIAISYGSRLKPMRDWAGILLLAGVLFASSAIWNTLLFKDVIGGGVLGQAPSSLPAVFSQESLDEIGRTFSERASQETKYLNGTYHFIDPSK